MASKSTTQRSSTGAVILLTFLSAAAVLIGTNSDLPWAAVVGWLAGFLGFVTATVLTFQINRKQH